VSLPFKEKNYPVFFRLECVGSKFYGTEKKAKQNHYTGNWNDLTKTEA